MEGEAESYSLPNQRDVFKRVGLQMRCRLNAHLNITTSGRSASLTDCQRITIEVQQGCRGKVNPCK